MQAFKCEGVFVKMNSKLIMFLGTVISALVIYLCIYYKKDEIALLLGVNDTATIHKSINIKEKEPQPQKQEAVEIKEVEKPETIVTKDSQPVQNRVNTKVVTEKSDPAFGLMLGETTKIVGMLAPRDRSKALITYITDYCQNQECDKDIRYSEDIKDVIWQKGIVKLIKFLKEENIEKGSIFINSNVLKVEGEITSSNQKQRLDEILTSLKNDGLEVIDHSIELKTDINEDKQEVIESTKENKIVEEEIVTVDNKTSLQDNINKTLLDNPIEFDSKNSKLTEKSKITLDKIIQMLKESGISELEIASYSQKSNDDIFEKVISQKKADVIKKYMNKNGISYVVSKGYGSTEFKFIENPQDLRNKRIEIRILK